MVGRTGFREIRPRPGTARPGIRKRRARRSCSANGLKTRQIDQIVKARTLKHPHSPDFRDFLSQPMIEYSDLPEGERRLPLSPPPRTS